MRSIKTTTAHHHSNNHPVDLLWEALKLRLPTTIVVQYKITIPTTIISWQPQLVSGSMSVRVIQGGRPQQLLPPGRRYVGQVKKLDCLVTWFCYQLIAKPGNKTATVSWPYPCVEDQCQLCTLLVLPASVEILHHQSFIFLCNPTNASQSISS